MAKSYGRIPTRWEGTAEWRQMSLLAQWLFTKLSSAAKVAYCGVGDWWPGRIAKTASGVSRDDVERAANELETSGWLFIDTETQEYVLREYMLDQGVLDQVNLPLTAAREWTDVASERIRALVAGEFQGHRSLLKKSVVEKDAVVDLLKAPSEAWPGAVPETGQASEPSQDGQASGRTQDEQASAQDSARASAQASGRTEVAQRSAQAPAQASGRTQNKCISTLKNVGDFTAVAPTSAKTPARADVEALCTHLADRVEANGSKRPSITKRWRDDARLLLDNDHRSLDEAHALVDWCQSDSFWRSNILSMSKFREKFDQLRLQRDKQRPGRGQATDIEEWMHA